MGSVKTHYEGISLDELVTFAVFQLDEEEMEATFEHIVAKCYELFPQKFSLVGYPQWPDSARVNKSWLRCRTDFGYLSGSVKSGFKLTRKGLQVVERVQKKIASPAYQRHNLKRRSAEERTREEKFMNQVSNSEALVRFNENPDSFELSEFEICDILFCTLESPFKTRKSNLRLLKEYAQRLKRSDIYDFLVCCENRYSHWIEGKRLRLESTCADLDRANEK